MSDECINKLCISSILQLTTILWHLLVWLKKRELVIEIIIHKILEKICMWECVYSLFEFFKQLY